MFHGETVMRETYFYPIFILMQSICRYELCELAADIIGKELETPDFLNHNIKEREYEKARYLYVYYCRVHLNCSFRVIRRTLWIVYRYPKTVYQVFGRQYKRHKEQEDKFLIQVFKDEFEKRLQTYTSQGIILREYGRQLTLFN